MSPSTHLAALAFPSCRCHPVTTTWDSKIHSVSSVLCLGGILTINYLLDSFISSA